MIFFEDLSKQEIEKIKNKEEIKEFSKNLKKATESDEREIRYETNKLLLDLSMRKRTKIDEIKTAETELKISKSVADTIKKIVLRKNFITEELV